MKNILAIGTLLILSSCASSPDVQPGVDGIHKISLRGEAIKETESAAHKQARSYCKDQNKTVEFLSDDTIKATPAEISGNSFKKVEAVATDIRFKCI